MGDENFIRDNREHYSFYIKVACFFCVWLIIILQSKGIFRSVSFVRRSGNTCVAVSPASCFDVLSDECIWKVVDFRAEDSTFNVTWSAEVIDICAVDNILCEEWTVLASLGFKCTRSIYFSFSLQSRFLVSFSSEFSSSTGLAAS